MKRFDRGAFVVLSLLTLCSTALELYCLATGQALAAKWLAAGGLLATAAGIVELEVSGLFERIIEHYGNEEKYPCGPPSYITREIIDNPDRPFATWVRNICFFNVRTGFWLIVVGTLVQVVAVWL
jgi:hypothetical protein